MRGKGQSRMPRGRSDQDIESMASPFVNMLGSSVSLLYVYA